MLYILNSQKTTKQYRTTTIIKQLVPKQCHARNSGLANITNSLFSNGQC